MEEKTAGDSTRAAKLLAEEVRRWVSRVLVFGGMPHDQVGRGEVPSRLAELGVVRVRVDEWGGFHAWSAPGPEGYIRWSGGDGYQPVLPGNSNPTQRDYDTSRCASCGGVVFWEDSPGGGWWKHLSKAGRQPGECGGQLVQATHVAGDDSPEARQSNCAHHGRYCKRDHD